MFLTNRIKSVLFYISVIGAFISYGFINNSQLKKQKLIINFEHFVGSDALRLDSVLYQNDLGQQFNVSKLRYYVSNISLKQANGKINTYPGYFLIDESQPTSKSIIINNIVPGTYSALNFIIGVDSIHNCSGVQSGALDPANGMFWAWNTGYIFLKLEGHAALSKSTGQIFEYHIGGYRYPNNCIRSIKLNLGEHCKVDPITNNCNINIKTDIAEIFKTPTAIDVSKLSSVTDFKNAGTIADNYSDMFSILNAK